MAGGDHDGAAKAKPPEDQVSLELQTLGSKLLGPAPCARHVCDP